MWRQAFLILVMAIVATPASAEGEDPLTRDLLILTDWFAGEFDNEEQLWLHRRSGAAGDPPVRVHTTHKRVALPEFGDHVFYVEEYSDHDPDKIYRQRLVIFSTDLNEAAIRVRQGFFKKADQVRGAQNDPDRLKGLTPSDVFFLDECDVFLRRVAGQFEGGMKPKSCVFGEGKDRRYAVHDITFSENKFWRIDATLRVADDSFYTGTPLDQPTRLRRANIFFCDVFFYGESGDQQVVRGLRVHGQGGTATAVRQSDGQSFDILLRSKEYPYYATRPDFIYYSLRHSGAARSVAYGIADPDSRHFGMNAGEVGVFCHREGYNFREDLDQL